MNTEPSTAESNTPLAAELTEETINMLIANTGIRREKILEWYETYKKESKNKCLDKKAFVKFYTLLLPRFGNPEQFANLVFRAFDKDNSGYIEFSEFLLSLTMSSKGSIEDRLNWTFTYYDQDRSGYIDVRELKNAIQAIYMLNNVKFGTDDPNSPENVAKKIFIKLDTDQDRKISRAEFVKGCLADGYLRHMLGPNI